MSAIGRRRLSDRPSLRVTPFVLHGARLLLVAATIVVSVLVYGVASGGRLTGGASGIDPGRDLTLPVLSQCALGVPFLSSAPSRDILLPIRHVALFSALVLVFPCVGCEGDDPGAPPDPPSSDDASGERRRPSRGDAGSPPLDVDAGPLGSCLIDPDCAAGSYCDLGACVAGCVSDDGCEGEQICTDFGRCSLAPVVVVADTRGRLDLRPLVFPALTPTDGSVPLTLLARDTAIERIRVVPSDGLAIDCPVAATDGECVLDDGLPEGETVAVGIRATRVAEADEVRVVRIYTAGRVRSVSVAPPGPSFSPVLAVNPTGVWEGTLEAVEDGFLHPTASLTAPSTYQQGPLRATIHASGVDSTGVVVLGDVFGVLHPEGEWIGQLDLSGTDNTLTLPSYVRHGSLGVGAPTMLRVDALVGPLHFNAASQSVYFDLEVQTRGMMDEGQGLTATYRANLRRTGDLPAGATAPAVPAAETFPVDGESCVTDSDCPDFSDTTFLGTSRGQSDFYIDRCSYGLTCQRAGREPTPWEAVAWQREIDENGDSFTEAEAVIARSFFGANAPAPLDYCFLDHDDFDYIRGGNVPYTPPMCGWFTNCSQPTNRKTFTEWQQYNPLHKVFADFFIQHGYTASTQAHISLDSSWRLPRGGQSNFRSDIPCEFDLPDIDIDITCGTTATRTFPATHIDMCDQVAAEAGCELTEDVFASTLNIPVNFLETSTWNGSEYVNDPNCGPGGPNPQWSMDINVQRVCRLKSVPESCSQTVLCGGTSPVTPVDSLTGEYRCAGSGLVGISADVRAAEAAALGQAIATDELFETCLSELDTLFKSGPTGPALEPLAAILAPSDCIQPTRFFTALGVALSTNHRLRLIDDGRPGQYENDVYGRSWRNERVAHRLVQRWLQIHAFLAQEASDREVLGRIVREEAVPGQEVPALDDILAASLRGWELFRHPRYALALAELDGDVLLSPDWRAEIDPNVVSASHHEHGTPLSVVILETLIAQLDLADEYLELAAFASNPAAIDNVKPLFIEAETMRAWASGLMRKAAATAEARGDALPWADAYQTALVGFTTARNRVVSRALDLLEGKNVLGIEESDLPLYFFGGQQDPGSRFSAISDFLLGKVGTSQVGWTTQLIDAADVSFQSARARWLALKNRGWQEARDSAAQQDKEAEVRISYGDAINDLCFLDAASYDVLDLPSLDPHTCYVKMSDPNCQVDVRTFARHASAADVGLQLCVAGRLIDQGFLGVEFGDARLTALAHAFAGSPDPCTTSSYDAECTTFGEAGCFTCELAAGPVGVPITPASMRVTSEASMATAIEQAGNDCMKRWPGARAAIPFASSLDNPACLRGAMGESALTILAAARDIEIAKAEYDQLQEGYDTLMVGCIALQTSVTKIQEATEKHVENMKGLREQKFIADTVANIAAGVKDCANSAVSAQGAFDPGSKGAAAAATGAACGAAAAEATAKVVSDSFQRSMDDAQDRHEATVAALEQTAAIAQCKAEAELQKVGQDAAFLRINRAVDGMVLAMYALDQQKRDVEVLFFEGKAELARVKGRAVSPPTAGLWLDEDVRGFQRRMRLARRVTYLAVRALEYEFQSSLGLRTTVLEAVTPNELRAVTDDLRTISATGGINGSLPTDLKVILSLRDHLMQVAPQESSSTGGQAMPRVERFRQLLASERFKSYDDEGNFIGLIIPFELAPLEVLGLGSSAGIGIIASQDCAERLWSANASVVGSQNVLRGGSSFTRVDLRKRNTFYSQWCGAQQDATQFQEASVRPSRNLFREPGFGTAVAGSVLGVARGTDAFTRARLQPAVNVPRELFEDDSYANGQTAELAGRGLYGNYELFIPANMLSLVINEVLTDGLDLNELDDILIRLDYVAGSQ